MNDSHIKEHMEVIGADGVHVGTVDRVENGRNGDIAVTFEEEQSGEPI